MVFALGPRAAGAGYRVVSFDTIGSTNAEALDRARNGDGGPLWIVAGEQTHGRGRRGRNWVTDRGNLAASLLIRSRTSPARAATLGFVASLAIGEAAQACAPGLSIALKWPNDVLADGAKLSGILLESERSDDTLSMVVGIGVNVVAAPSDTAYPATSFAALGRKVRPENLFAALSDAWVDLYRVWDEGAGMPRIRALWLARAAGIGQTVSVSLGDRIIEGVFDTLDEQGRLMVRSADGALVPVSAGDVYFGLARTAASLETR